MNKLMKIRGAPKGRARGARALTFEPKKHYIFRVSSVKLCDLRLCNTCSKAFCFEERSRSLQRVKELS